jgi:hypothetical protein
MEYVSNVYKYKGMGAVLSQEEEGSGDAQQSSQRRLTGGPTSTQKRKRETMVLISIMVGVRTVSMDRNVGSK